MYSESALATVLFIDIVDSTRVATELGNRAWHGVVQQFYGRIRRELRASGGREINTAGDAFVAAIARSRDLGKPGLSSSRRPIAAVQ